MAKAAFTVCPEQVFTVIEKSKRKIIIEDGVNSI